MLLDSRSKNILNYLLNQYEYVTLGALMKEFNISRRTTYYAIQKVNEWLSVNKIADIEIERNKGIFLSNIQKNEIQLKLSEENDVSKYVFSPKERIYTMICLIIQSNIRITIEYLMNYFFVSRNTVFSDLKELLKILDQYNLYMTNDVKTGYQITGDPIKIRAVFFFYINLLQPLIKDEIIDFFDKEDVKQKYAILKNIEKELNVTFVDGTLEALAILLPIMEKNTQDIKINGISHEKIEQSLEYGLVKKYFSALSIEESYYLTIHLLGSRLQSIPTDVVPNIADNETKELTKILVSEFKRVACVEFVNQAEIERTLFAHLHTSLYRYKYGIQLGNPMMEEIKNEYSSLFEITKKASEVLTSHIGSPIPDSEIAYLTLHFGGFLRSMKTQVNVVKVLVICPNGISTGNMLSAEIKALLPNANVLNPISLKEFENDHWECDFIVSTIALKTDIPFVVVHPIMTDSDRIQILKRSMSKLLVQNRNVNVEDIFNVVKKYVEPSQHKNLYKDLDCYISSLSNVEQVLSSPKSNSLMSFLDLEHIKIVEETMSWTQAIHYSCETLIEDGAITSDYSASIISQLHVYGPYMFITPDVVLAHAKSEDGSLKLACNLVVFKEKIKFTANREAKIILVLSAPDAESHLEILHNINQIFSNSNNAEILYNCSSRQDILNKMNTMLAQSD